MPIHRLPHWRRPFAVALLIVLGVAGTACGTKHRAPQSMTIVATASAAEPAVTLPDTIKRQVAAFAQSSDAIGGATVRIVSSATGTVVEHDMTPLRGQQVEHAPAARDKKIHDALLELGRQLSGLTADRPGLNLLALLDRASLLPGSNLVVLSSGLSTADPLDFRQLASDGDAESIVESVKRQGMLPNLAGRHVTLVGLGQSSGTQPTEPPQVRNFVSQVWLALCLQAGAAMCVEAGRDDAAPPAAQLPVPVVPIPAVYTARGCPVWARLSDDEQLRFPPDQAVMPAEANTALSPIVQAAIRCSLIVDVAGFIADTGSGTDVTNLSGSRARAVADRLVALGLPTALLGTVVGRGAADPVIDNLVGGTFDESRAALNRRVELTFRRQP
ncbi:OmpA family protein [Nocardia sp. NPDC003482]